MLSLYAIIYAITILLSYYRFYIPKVGGTFRYVNNVNSNLHFDHFVISVTV